MESELNYNTVKDDIRDFCNDYSNRFTRLLIVRRFIFMGVVN